MASSCVLGTGRDSSEHNPLVLGWRPGTTESTLGRLGGVDRVLGLADVVAEYDGGEDVSYATPRSSDTFTSSVVSLPCDKCLDDWFPSDLDDSNGGCGSSALGLWLSSSGQSRPVPHQLLDGDEAGCHCGDARQSQPLLHLPFPTGAPISLEAVVASRRGNSHPLNASGSVV